MENQKKEKEITFGYLINVFKKSFIFMVIAAMVFGVVGIVYSKVIEKPKYQSTATFIVTNNSPENYTTSGLTMASTSIAATCVEFATHDLPARMVAEHKNADGVALWETLKYESVEPCAQAIKKMITAKKSPDDVVFAFYITITSSSRNVTYEVTKAMQEVFPETVNQIFSSNNENASSLISSTGGLQSEAGVRIVKSSAIKVGFILAVVAAMVTYCIFFVKAMMDKSIHGEETLKENFDYPIVGVIPSFATQEEIDELKKYRKMKSDRAVAPRHYENKLLNENSPFHMTESFNTLRTNVIFSAVAAKKPVFAVTSDIAAAGKTVVAANLSIALSNLGKKVLLVECDMRCPSFSKLFGKISDAGLSELLAGIETDTSKLAVQYDCTSLDVLVCGKIPPNPSELLSGYRMSELVEEWKEKYDYIVLDMPPIGEVYDAGVVSSIVNGYVITARANHSNINNVNIAVDRIESVGGNVLGLILNDATLKTGKKYKTYYNSYSQ